MIKTKNSAHRSEINLKERIGIDAAYITDSAQYLPRQGLLPVLEGEVHHRDLGVDVVEAIVRLLVQRGSGTP
jgi:hypothetical protein